MGHAVAETSCDQNNYGLCVCFSFIYSCLFTCLIKDLSCLFFTVNGQYQNLALLGDPPPLPYPYKTINLKQSHFYYLFALLCFVFTSGHIIIEGGQEIVFPIGSLMRNIKGKSQINLVERSLSNLIFHNV